MVEPKIETDNNLLTLLRTNQQESSNKTIQFLKKLINNDKFLCLYITFNKPSKVLEKTFKSKGININNLIFIDTVTRLSEDADLEKNFIYVDSPKKLTDILIIVRDRLEVYSDVKKRYVFVDSLSHIMNYNPSEKRVKFIQGLTNKLRLVDVKGGILAIEGGSVKEEHIQECAKCVDAVKQL